LVFYLIWLIVGGQMPLDARKGGVSDGADGALFAANQLMAHN